MADCHGVRGRGRVRALHRLPDAELVGGDAPGGVDHRRLSQALPRRDAPAPGQLAHRLQLLGLRRPELRRARRDRRDPHPRRGARALGRAPARGRDVAAVADRRVPVPRGRLPRSGRLPRAVRRDAARRPTTLRRRHGGDGLRADGPRARAADRAAAVHGAAAGPSPAPARRAARRRADRDRAAAARGPGRGPGHGVVARRDARDRAPALPRRRAPVVRAVVRRDQRGLRRGGAAQWLCRPSSSCSCRASA